MEITINELSKEDWKEAERIYREGIETGQATFETETPDYDEWDAKHIRTCRLAGRCNGRLMGFVVLSPTSSREVYRGVAEVSIYVSEEARNKGVGKALMKAIVETSEVHGFWTLQSSIFAENQVSIALHRAFGFRELGRREKIAKRNGTWRDTVIMERRSKIVGID